MTRSTLALFVFAAGSAAFAKSFQPAPVLSFGDLVALSETSEPSLPLQEKLSYILSTPDVNNLAALHGFEPHRPWVNGLGPVLRVVSWNIERGLEFDLIRLAFSDPDGLRLAAAQRSPVDPDKLAAIESQAQVLRDADIIILNEVDLGMKRTDYRDVARELSEALGMNYAFGVEFVEVDRLEDLGVEDVKLEDAQAAQRMQQELRPDPALYRGLHGNAILSRYPIERARIVRLPVCHDWFNAERAGISMLEKGKRLAADKIFLERMAREVRQGGRMALIADVKIPDLSAGAATVVSVHLENKCKPACRARQMDALLSRIQDVDHPLILGGDLNTTGADGTPTSIRRELTERVKNYEFWVTQALKWASPAALPLLALTPAGYLKNYRDPTSVHIPVIGSNREARLFRHLEKFRFDNRRAFDFRGDTARNLHGKGKTLANSNQRGTKGFVPTYGFKRDFGGLVGRFRLDWIFVSPFINMPRDESLSYRFAPHYPRTLRELNNAVPDGISDHAPISVDLPFAEPAPPAQ